MQNKKVKLHECEFAVMCGIENKCTADKQDIHTCLEILKTKCPIYRLKKENLSIKKCILRIIEPPATIINIDKNQKYIDALKNIEKICIENVKYRCGYGSYEPTKATIVLNKILDQIKAVQNDKD